MKGMTRGLVNPGVRDRNQVGKHVWKRARKAVCMSKAPVPQTDTGRQVENTKAREITLVKELCKMNP